MKIARLFALLLLPLMVIAGCTATPPSTNGPVTKQDTSGQVSEQVAQDEVTKLTNAIMAMGPGIDPEEARSAASISYSYTAQLAREYEITDPPLVHNTKVNMGIKPRGLCWHWAEDMEKRLKQERFKTLQLHRAIANHDKAFRIEHSTAIISRRGDTMEQGIILDPWREGGTLFWSPLPKDTRYEWHPRAEVLAYKRELAAAAQ
ncbi:hypothetical protein [Roseovarius sp. EL26]|uniref:hypothetical protein n=1 Tax=Roseovarius sp. EL26 TaxID=2126672 RepID=UPI000EA22672|nr:hypothetical protein [Roseovarius sp. EL26]